VAGASIRPDPWLNARSVLFLQRTVGNTVVTQWLRSRAAGQPPGVAAPRPPAIIQRLRSANSFNRGIQPAAQPDAILGNVARHLEGFAKAQDKLPTFTFTDAAKQTAREARQEMLASIQALNLAIHAWFDANKAVNLEHVPNSELMYGLLDEVQVEHQQLIADIAQRQDELPISAAGLDDAEQQRTQTMWRALITGQGNVQIDDRAGVKGFRTEALASFANLMQSRAGRDLIESLQQDPTRPPGTNAGSDPGRRITIEPDAPTGKFAASDRDQSSSLHVLRPQPARANPTPANLPAGFRQLDQEQNLTEQWRRRPGQTGVSIGHGGQTRDYAFGAGQGAQVSFPVGSRARSHGIKTDAQGNQILSPSFIVLGHELYHAEHYLQGSTATSTSDTGVIAQSAGDIETHQLLAGVSGQGAGEYDEYESTEEYVTVLHNENYLRDQYALTSRASHLEQGMFIAGRVGNLLKRGDLTPAEQQEIELLQNALGLQRWLENNRRKTVNDPDFATVFAEREAQLPLLIAQLGLRDMDAVMNRIQAVLAAHP
jgi:hypothetical protein